MKSKLSTLGLATLVTIGATALTTTMAQAQESATEGIEGDKTVEGGTYSSAKSKKGPRGELYGFAMVDMGYNDGSTNDKWFDVVRPTQMPSSDAEVGGNGFTTPGSIYASVRQTRFGIKGWFPTDSGKEVHTIFEFEMFGVGDDAGQTTIRLRHAYGEMGAFGGGQYWSPFMDINVFPNSVEYWGPSGMAFFRNIQFRWMPIRDGKNDLTFALEKPGAGRDSNVDIVEDSLNTDKGGRDVRSRYPVPDLSGAYSYNSDWGYVRIAGILRYISWDDETIDPATGQRDNTDISDEVLGYGLNLSANFKFGPGDSVLKFAIVGGQGIENYMNESTGDIAADCQTRVNTAGELECDPTTLTGEAIPMVGTTLFYDLWWSEKFSSTIGFSTLDLDNPSDSANASNFKTARYALLNLLYYPASNVMFGGELQYGYRENESDGFDYDLYRIQFSARYNFSFGLGG
jgi:hypothetical protein